MKIKKGDNVIVISGKDKGKSGKVLEAYPKESRVLIDGVNKKKKHERPRKSGQKGQIIEKSYPLDVSNVMFMDGDKRTRVGYKMDKGKKVRISKKSGAII